MVTNFPFLYLTLSVSDTISLWHFHFLTLSFSDAFSFWQFQFVTLSTSGPLSMLGQKKLWPLIFMFLPHTILPNHCDGSLISLSLIRGNKDFWEHYKQKREQVSINAASYLTLGASQSGCGVRVMALPSGGSRFEPRSWQLVKAIGGISDPCKIVYDWWNNDRQTSVQVLVGTIADGLSVVLVNA